MKLLSPIRRETLIRKREQGNAGDLEAGRGKSRVQKVGDLELELEPKNMHRPNSCAKGQLLQVRS